MSSSETLEPTAEVQRQLELANSQLALYARDLKRIVDAERQKARELAQANTRLQILDRLKTHFLSFISHELRTPLNGIGAIALLNPQADPKEQTSMIALIRRGHKRLNEFVQKGLEYFQWVATERRETAEITDLTAIIRRVIDQLPVLAEPGVHFQLSVPGVSCLVRGEAEHVAGVVKILLDNAIKFSPQEKIIAGEVRATAERVTLRVSDCGQGFPPELGEELFQPFTIANVCHHSRGTGLNLAIARAIVAAYGGRMRADSAGVGKGATFTVEFPRVSLPGEAPKTPISAPW